MRETRRKYKWGRKKRTRRETQKEPPIKKHKRNTRERNIIETQEQTKEARKIFLRKSLKVLLEWANYNKRILLN